MHSVFSLAVTFGFQTIAFTLQEDSGDTDVVFGKVNNDSTELNVSMIIAFDSISTGLMTGHHHYVNSIQNYANWL